MLQKNLDKQKRREKRLPMGRPTKFKTKKDYDRKKWKNSRKNDDF